MSTFFGTSPLMSPALSLRRGAGAMSLRNPYDLRLLKVCVHVSSFYPGKLTLSVQRAKWDPVGEKQVELALKIVQ